MPTAALLAARPKVGKPVRRHLGHQSEGASRCAANVFEAVDQRNDKGRGRHGDTSYVMGHFEAPFPKRQVNGSRSLARANNDHTDASNRSGVISSLQRPPPPNFGAASRQASLLQNTREFLVFVNIPLVTGCDGDRNLGQRLIEIDRNECDVACLSWSEYPHPKSPGDLANLATAPAFARNPVFLRSELGSGTERRNPVRTQ